MKPKFFLLLVVPLFCTSCYHVYYAPNTANAPLLSQKGEARLNGLIATGLESEFVGAELQSAYAINRNWGVMLNFLTAKESENTGNYIETGRGSYAEAATGFFAPISSNKKWIAELYGGLGTGSVINEYGNWDESKVGVTKFFLQPSIGYKTGSVEFAVVPRLSQVRLQVKRQQFLSGENDYAKQDIDAITARSQLFAFEPSFIFRGGGEIFKISVALSFCNMSGFEYNQPNETLNASIGASVSLRPKKKS